MTMNFIGLVFICMLPLMASSQNTNNSTTEITGNLPHEQVTQKMSIFTSPITDVNSKAEETPKTTRPLLVSAAQTVTSKTPLPDASTDSISSHPNSPTIGKNTMPEVKVTTPATMVVSHQAGNQTTAARVNPTPSSSTQSPETGKTSTSLFTSNETTHSSTSVTNQISTTASSTTPVSKTPPAIVDDATGSTRKTSTTTTKTPVIQITTAKKPNPPQKKSEKGTKDSKIVAGLISGALLLMMVGFLIIYLKKRKLREQQTMTSDWAGPSPFLEGGADNGGVALRSSNRVSLSSFLPQRLSKRLSLLQETDEELQEITPGSTFGSTYQGSSFGREVDENCVKERNGTAAPEIKTTEGAAETVETPVSLTSSQTNDAPSTNNNSKTANQSDPPAQSEAVENTTAQMDNKEN